MSSVKRNSFYGLLGFAIPTAVLLLAYPVLLRALGPTAFGIYLLATSMSGTLAFFDGGFSSAMLKFVAEDMVHGRTQDAARIIDASILFYGLFGGGCAIALWFLAPWLVSLFRVSDAFASSATWSFRLAAIQFPAFMLATVFISLFKSLHKFHLSSAALGLLSVLTYGGAIAGVSFFHFGLIGITAVSLAANVSLLVFSAILGIRLCGLEGIHLAQVCPALATFRRMLAFGSVMTINSVSAMLLYQVQKYLVGIFLGPAAVTVYQTASIPPSRIHAAVNAFTEVMFPIASGAGDKRRLRTIYLGMMAASIMLVLLAFAPLLLAARPLVTLWMGTRDATAVIALIPVFAVGYAFLALSPAPFHLLNGMGKAWLNTAFFAFNAVLNVLLIALFVRGGMTLMKFAWAFCIANVITAVAYQITIELVIWRNWGLRRPLAAGVV